MLQHMRWCGDNRKQSTQASRRPPGPASRFHGGCAPSTAAGAGGRDQDFLFCTGDSWSDTRKWETTSGASQPRGKVKPRHMGDRCSLFLSLGKKAPLALRQWTPNTEAAQWAWKGAQATVHGHTAARCRSSGGEVRITKVSVGKSMETPLRCH